MNCIICEKEVEHVRNTPTGTIYECAAHGLLLLKKDGSWSNEEEIKKRMGVIK